MPIDRSALACVRHETFQNVDLYYQGDLRFVKLSTVYNSHRRFYREHTPLEFFNILRAAKRRDGRSVFAFHPDPDAQVPIGELWVAAPPSGN